VREDILFCCFRVDCTDAGRNQVEGVFEHSSGELDTEINFRIRRKQSDLCVHDSNGPQSSLRGRAWISWADIGGWTLCRNVRFRSIKQLVRWDFIYLR
jgi:hypothetical protein